MNSAKHTYKACVYVCVLKEKKNFNLTTELVADIHVSLFISGTATTCIKSVAIKKTKKKTLSHDLTSITSYIATLAANLLKSWNPNIFSFLFLL